MKLAAVRRAVNSAVDAADERLRPLVQKSIDIDVDTDTGEIFEKETKSRKKKKKDPEIIEEPSVESGAAPVGAGRRGTV